MKRQMFAIAFATVSALSTFSLINVAAAQSTSQSKTVIVQVDRADTTPGIAFDPGSSIEARPDMMLRVFVDNQRIAQVVGPENQVSAGFNVRSSGRSDKALIPVRVELYDKDSTTQEGIDVNPLGGLKSLNLRYNPSTGEILNEKGTKIAQRSQFFDMEGLGDGQKKATIRLSIAHQ